MVRVPVFLRTVVGSVSRFVLGQHPNNTIFSFNWHNVRHIRRFLDRARRRMGSGRRDFADIGGGACPYQPIFADLAASYTCVDVSEGMDFGGRSIRYVQGAAEAIPLPDGTVDVALCNQVLEHVLDPNTCCAEIYRILRPGGSFVGSVPHLSPVHLEPHDYRRFTDLGIEKLLREAGFSDVSVDVNTGVFASAAFIVNMDLMLSRRRGEEPQKFRSARALLLSPIVGALNALGLILDALLGDRGRSYCNICWIASRPIARDAGTESSA